MIDPRVGATSLHEQMAGLLDRTGALSAVMQMRRLAPIPTVAIVTFHHVPELPDGESYPYDPDVADATPGQLRRHLETLARIGTPIGIDVLLGALAGRALPPNPVMVTFDDGYRSCHDIALPILRELGIPATFFIATSFVTERRLYWWEAIATILHVARARRATLTYPYPMEVDAADPGTRRRLDNLVKDTWGLDVDRFLAELARALDVEWTRAVEATHANELIMTWAQVRALARAGMDVESHTRTHRVLQTLDDARLRDELEGSRVELESQLGRSVKAIAYPVGRRIPGDLRVRSAVASAGYRLGLCNSGGVNPMWPAALRAVLPVDPFDVRRISTERSMSDAMFLTQIAVPALGYASR